MDGLEEKLGAMLNNPQLMQQIMAMAQSMGQPSQQETPRQEPSPLAGLDLGLIQKLSGAAAQAGPDRNQQALLQALHPYLSSERIGRLEKAMRAAKMAKLATVFLGSNQGR